MALSIKTAEADELARSLARLTGESMTEAVTIAYLRVPMYCPFRLQFYCNGHSWLARQLTAEGIGHTMADNAFVAIDDWSRAQELADGFRRTCCTAPWTAMRSSAARWLMCLDTPATGA